MTDRPDWWDENQALRDRLGLPAYEAPRFEDGTYAHRVVDRLEERFDCRLRFVGYNTEYPEDWAVEADGDPLFPIGRHRDSDGNTVYETTAAEFEREVVDGLAADEVG